MTLGEKIKTRRKELNLTQKELAEKVCISRKAISSYENEKAEPRSRDIYEKLAKALQCERDYLMADGNNVVTNSEERTVTSTTKDVLYAIAKIMKIFMPANAIEKMQAPLTSITRFAEESGIDINMTDEAREIIFQKNKSEILFQRACEQQIMQILKLNGVSFHKEENSSENSEFCLKISRQRIEYWHFCFYQGAAGSRFWIDLLAKVLFCKHASLKADSGRKVSIVVSNTNLYEALAKFEKNNSYRGNCSVILAGYKTGMIRGETTLSTYAEDGKDPLRIVYKRGWPNK